MDTNILLPRIKDTVDTVFRTDKPKFLGFLSVEEAAFTKKYLTNQNVKFTFFGGAENCERTYLGCFPQWLDEPQFPITALTFTFRDVDTLRHRDFLGALMALGLKRETVGDILIEKGRAVVFLNKDIADFVAKNLTKIGNVGVSAEFFHLQNLPKRDSLVEASATVASLRLDCVVSVLANCSRKTAVSMIESGLVSVNSVITEKSTKLISDGDVLAVRHKGKFIIASTDKRTKKDRIVLVYNKY
ncbi:MAG: hypothetical protein IJD45_00640 [Clostridia bacterium]|nr:hypothetical protein [Clostridia bacterium]